MSHKEEPSPGEYIDLVWLGFVPGQTRAYQIVLLINEEH